MVLPSQRVEADLRARLAAGEWEPGGQLPTTRALAAHYGVSGRTVAKALAVLARDGLITVVPNWGSFRSE
jgi:GntR family transcriptional regulator